ncbi:MAG: hypothetical protein HC927_01100 [Deltaproteobacteria bacterium]|nr:hypothetical protein [Deltaproteobacteria bacterium]
MQAATSSAPADGQSPSRAWIHRSVGALGVCVLLVHFTITLIYLNPISVVGLASRGRVVEYMEPYFRQRWSLFAPDPPLFNRRLDYQCEVDGEIGPWKSRTGGLLDAHARFRFGPSHRMRRYEQAAMSAMIGVKDPVLDEIIAGKDSAPQAQREAIELRLAQLTADKIQGSKATYELSADYCREEIGEPDRVRFRLTTETIAPFSERDNPDWAPEQEIFVAEWLAPSQFDGLTEQAAQYMRDYLAGVEVSGERGAEP